MALIITSFIWFILINTSCSTEIPQKSEKVCIYYDMAEKITDLHLSGEAESKESVEYECRYYKAMKDFENCQKFKEKGIQISEQSCNNVKECFGLEEIYQRTETKIIPKGIESAEEKQCYFWIILHQYHSCEGFGVKKDLAFPDASDSSCSNYRDNVCGILKKEMSKIDEQVPRLTDTSINQKKCLYYEAAEPFRECRTFKYYQSRKFAGTNHEFCRDVEKCKTLGKAEREILAISQSLIFADKAEKQCLKFRFFGYFKKCQRYSDIRKASFPTASPESCKKIENCFGSDSKYRLWIDNYEDNEMPDDPLEECKSMAYFDEFKNCDGTYKRLQRFLFPNVNDSYCRASSLSVFSVEDLLYYTLTTYILMNCVVT